MQDLIQMLKEYEIKNIVSVDDDWGVAEGLLDKIAAQGIEANSTVKDYCDLYAIDIAAEETEVFRELSHTALKDLADIEFKMPHMFTAICESLEVAMDISLKILKDVLGQLAKLGKFEIYRGVKFEDDYKKLVGNTLYILDKDMGENRENEFLEYILSILNQRTNNNDLIIIYSNEVSGLLNHQEKLQYLESCDTEENELAILYQFWPLSKSGDEDRLISGIKEMMSKSMYGRTLSKMIEVKRISVEKAFKDLLQINIDNLDDMIIDAYVEGGKITDSYELLMESFIKRNALEQVMDSDVLEYEKDLLHYGAKRIKEILEEKEIVSKTKYENLRNESAKKKLLTSLSVLYNIADYSVNQRYENPAMGDIYVFTEARTKKRYVGMLISQECSMMIRLESFPDGIGRKAEELLLLLFDYIEITEENVKRFISKQNIKKLNDYIWPIKINEKTCLLEGIKRSMYVRPEILDLCGLNSSGQAKLQFDVKNLDYKSVYSQEYYKNFEQNVGKKIQEMSEQVIQANGIESPESNIKNLIISLAYGIEFDGDFKMQRICKIEEKQALHIIHEYLNDIAKIGLQVLPNV